MSSLQTRPAPRRVALPECGAHAAAPKRPAWIATVVVLLAYSAYAVFLTWPLATNPGGLLSGSSLHADLAGSVAQIAYVVQHHVFPFAPAVFHGINAPQGLAQPWVENIASFPGTALLVGLGFVFGAVASSAVFLWLSFVLSGLSMFWLTRRLFGNALAAALAGFAFAFFPWAVDKLNGHYQYMDGWVLVLAVWRLLEMIQAPSRRNALLAGCATALAMWFTFYFILIAGVAFATLAVVALVVGRFRRRRGGFRTVLVSASPIVALFGALGALAVLEGGATAGAVRTQSIQDLYAFSARPLEWLLPDRHNLIFGGLTRGYLSSHLHGSNFGESSLYLGISVLVLAVAGLVIAVRLICARGRAALEDRAVVGAVSGGALALVAVVFSLPPTVRIFGFPVAMPSALIYRITSTWRVYSRFVELVELGLCVLMAFAVARLLARASARKGLAVFAGLALVVVVDLWARPPIRTRSVAPPAEYVWLRDHPGGIVADYPIELAAYPDYHGLFWQTFDGHPFFQGYTSGSEAESMKLEVANLREPTTASDLAMMGVKYIVVHPGMAGATAATIRAGHYIVRFSSPSGSVWQVGAAPARTRVDALDSFTDVHGPPGGEYRWMGGPGVLGVYAHGCPSCTGTVRFASSSNHAARVLTVREQGRAAVLTRVRIPAGASVDVVVPGVTLSHGTARLLLTTNIAPSMFEPGYDPGPYSVSVREPRLSLESRAAARRS